MPVSNKCWHHISFATKDLILFRSCGQVFNQRLGEGHPDRKPRRAVVLGQMRSELRKRPAVYPAFALRATRGSSSLEDQTSSFSTDDVDVWRYAAVCCKRRRVNTQLPTTAFTQQYDDWLAVRFGTAKRVMKQWVRHSVRCLFTSYLSTSGGPERCHPFGRRCSQIWTHHAASSRCASLAPSATVQKQQSLCPWALSCLLQQRLHPSRRYFWSGKSTFSRMPWHASPFDKNTARPTEFPCCSPNCLERASATSPLIIHQLRTV